MYDDEFCPTTIKQIADTLNRADAYGGLLCEEYLEMADKIDQMNQRCDSKEDASRFANALVAIDQHWKSRPTSSEKPAVCILKKCSTECPPENIFGRSNNPDPIPNPRGIVTRFLPCICNNQVIDQTLLTSAKIRKPNTSSKKK